MVIPYRGAFRTWLNSSTREPFFAKIPNGVEPLTFSQEKIHARCFTGLKIGFWLRVLHIEPTFVPNLQIEPKKYSARKYDIIFEKAKVPCRKVNRASVYADAAVRRVL